MIAWKKHLAATRGVSSRDRLLIKTDMIGTLGSLLAPIANWVMGRRFLRRLMESWVGVHRDRQVLHFSPETFSHWWEGRGTAQVPASASRKVALFGSCLINYQSTDIGKATIQVLEKNGVHVVIPEQRCCGMPSYDIGDTAAIPGDTPNTTFRCAEDGLATGLDDPDKEKFGSSHSSGTVECVFLDGHVAGLHPDMNVDVLKALSTIGGGEVVPSDN
jgi:hypothetical protein